MPAGAPEMPEGLSELEQATWRKLCAMLVPVGVVTQADGLAMLGLVDAVRAFDDARRGGDPVETRFARADYLRWLGKFGLTPADRTSVSGGGAGSAESKAAMYLRGQ